jgi:glycosyltransferase involved in cell wall biosynthesis
MKVLMTADAVGGVWTYALDLARALSGHGVTTALATMGRLPSPDQRADALSVPGLTLHACDFKLEWEDDPWDDVAAAGAWLLDIERRERPDMVHLNGYAHGIVPFAAPKLVVGHSCVLSWWRAVKGEGAPPTWGCYHTAVRAGLRAADAVAAPTQAMADALVTHYGPLPCPVRMLPNGRACGLFAPAAKEPFVFAAGRLWDEAKNVSALAAVAPQLAWPVCVAGEGGNGANVRALGHLPPGEVAAWLGRAAVYSLPARYEPFGLSVLEAALSGCALVLGDIPSLRENWEGAAVFVAPGDRDRLRATLTRLVERDHEREWWAACALARASEPRFTAAAMADGYLTLYEELAAKSELKRKTERTATCAS